MADPVPKSSQRQDDRRDRRRVGALLNQYYAIEGAGRTEEPSEVPAELGSELDRQGFDARRYFDNIVSLGQLPELVRRNDALETEVRDLDATMQTLVYENYSKFIRATDVIRRMKGTMDGMDGDLKRLEGSLGRALQHEEVAESGVCERAGQLGGLLRQQQVCRKLKILFGLPNTLQECLRTGAYARAAAAYRCCISTLEQHRQIPSFLHVLEEAEVHMGKVRAALQAQLRQPDLSVDEAVSSAMTLISLGEDHTAVAQEYVAARTSSLQQSCKECFEAATTDCAPGHHIENGAHNESEVDRPEGNAFQSACMRAAEFHVPLLCDAVEGLKRVQDFYTATASAGDGGVDDRIISDFVVKQIEELTRHVSAAAKRSCLPTKLFLACVQALRESFERLSPLVPRLLPRLCTAFVNAAVGSAVNALFSHASVSLVASLSQLHEDCTRFDEANSSDLEQVLEQIVTTEQAIIMGSFSALSSCQPLLTLLGADRSSCQQLVQGIQAQLIIYFLAFVEACYVYAGHDADEAWTVDPSLPMLDRVSCKELEDVARWAWNGLFALALVRIGRHLEVKAIGKVSDVARDLFAAGAGSVDCQPHPSVLRATRAAAQAVITHYVLLHGQRVASGIHALISSTTASPAHETHSAVAALMREVYAVDDQLAGILSDPRKPRDASRQYRSMDRFRNSMELEMERLWAKKLQVYAPIPFNRNGATLGVLRIGFKALYEYVRERTFSKAGLQQLQVDCAALQESLRDLVASEDAGVLESLLDEAITSAAQRCPEPELLEASVVEELRGVRARAEEGRG